MDNSGYKLLIMLAGAEIIGTVRRRCWQTMVLWYARTRWSEAALLAAYTVTYWSFLLRSCFVECSVSGSIVIIPCSVGRCHVSPIPGRKTLEELARWPPDHVTL